MIKIQTNNVSDKKTDDIDNNAFVFLIIKIIFLTNLPAFAILPVSFKSGIGWISGSVASAVNFWFMARHTIDLMPQQSQENVKKISKIFLFRYFFIVLWSLLILIFVKPDLISYCLGLLSAQISIVAYQCYNYLRNGRLKKYFRGKNE